MRDSFCYFSFLYLLIDFLNSDCYKGRFLFHCKTEMMCRITHLLKRNTQLYKEISQHFTLLLGKSAFKSSTTSLSSDSYAMDQQLIIRLTALNPKQTGTILGQYRVGLLWWMEKPGLRREERAWGTFFPIAFAVPDIYSTE